MQAHLEKLYFLAILNSKTEFDFIKAIDNELFNNLYLQNMNMKLVISTVTFLLICAYANGQKKGTDWYSETENNGIIIQNSYPKGGPYKGPTKEHFNYSYLVFFTRIVNETDKTIDLDLNFSGDPFRIPNSPNTFVRLFLPSDKMSMDKRPLFSYGITELESLEQATQFQKTINPKEDVLFYVVAIFYQTEPEAWRQERGGNRAELVLKGQDLYYKMLPQVDSLPCGRITFK